MTLLSLTEPVYWVLLRHCFFFGSSELRLFSGHITHKILWYWLAQRSLVCQVRICLPKAQVGGGELGVFSAQRKMGFGCVCALWDGRYFRGNALTDLVGLSWHTEA